MFLNEFIKLYDQPCFSYLKIQLYRTTYPRSSHALFCQRLLTQVLTVIDSLLNVKKKLQIGVAVFSPSRAALTLVTPLYVPKGRITALADSSAEKR